MASDQREDLLPDLPEPPQEPPSALRRLRRLLIGKPRDLSDRSIFHRLSLIPFLAWVGLGADGLSSSSYGPMEAFRTLGDHTFLALGLAVMIASTVLIIAAAYSRIIEQFPHGGGGYVVATRLLGERAGVISGNALLVDYVLTIAVSIAAAGDALFSFVPLEAHFLKVPLEVLCILSLTTLNMRGVRESVLVLLPIFLVFLLTHVVLIGGGVITHLSDLGRVSQTVSTGFHNGLGALGFGGMGLLLLHAYSLGGGTYTGLEAVSNGLTIMREPRVHTAKRTMLYMALSLAFTAGGLMLCYLLVGVRFEEGKTLNTVLADALAGDLPGGGLFVLVTILSEGALLIVGAQAGFIDGPRVLANMAIDSWVPRRFAALSDRLATQNGVLLMGVASLAALLYTRGDIQHLVVMYSINVFLTFSLSMLGMLRYWLGARGTDARWKGRAALFGVGLVLCAAILLITTVQKFGAGGWLTLLVTGICVVLCLVIRGHYRAVGASLTKIDQQLQKLADFAAGREPVTDPPDPSQPTAVMLVASYSGLGIHNFMQVNRAFAGHFKSFLFISVGTIDQGAFKGQEAVDALRASAEHHLRQYVELAQKLGFPATSRLAIGTDVVDETEKLCLEIAKEFPRAVFFTGRIIFRQEKWYHRPLHNQTAYAIQKRLQWQGLNTVVLPVRVQ